MSDLGHGEPTWLSLLPPLLAIGGALVFKRVVPALALGVLVGAAMVHGAVAAPLRFFDRYLWNALTDSGHQWILALALCLGGMIRVISKTDIAASMAGGLTRYATTRRRGQLTSWVLGVLFFFDDYVNTLFVGSTMGSIRKKLRISKEKLAFVVDATAAPVASLAPISTWIATEIAYIGDQIDALGIEGDAFGLFLRSLSSRYYSWLMLATVLLVAITNRDMGPMLKAERRAATEVADDEPERPTETTASIGWLAAWLPILLVLVTVTAGVFVTGYLGATDAGAEITPASVLNNAESSKVMVLGALIGGIAAVLIAARSPRHNLRDATRSWGSGGLSMLHVMAVLLLAWALGDLCRDDLNTAGFLVSVLGPGFDPGLLPAMVFLVSAITSFATGTSWGTMGIMFPLAVPMAHQLAPGNEAVLLSTISSILAGSVFGDHCSPISDTTIMSAMATECDQIAHVRTQLPYALLVGTVSVIFGCVPVGLGIWPAWLALLMGAITIFLVLHVVARPVEERTEITGGP